MTVAPCPSLRQAISRREKVHTTQHTTTHIAQHHTTAHSTTPHTHATRNAQRAARSAQRAAHNTQEHNKHYHTPTPQHTTQNKQHANHTVTFHHAPPRSTRQLIAGQQFHKTQNTQLIRSTSQVLSSLARTSHGSFTSPQDADPRLQQ